MTKLLVLYHQKLFAMYQDSSLQSFSNYIRKTGRLQCRPVARI